MKSRAPFECPKCQKPIGKHTRIPFFSALGLGFAAELILWGVVGILGVVVSTLGFGSVFVVALLIAGGCLMFLLSRTKSYICQHCSEELGARLVREYNKSLNSDAGKAGAG